MASAATATRLHGRELSNTPTTDFDPVDSQAGLRIIVASRTRFPCIAGMRNELSNAGGVSKWESPLSLVRAAPPSTQESSVEVIVHRYAVVAGFGAATASRDRTLRYQAESCAQWGVGEGLVRFRSCRVTACPYSPGHRSNSSPLNGTLPRTNRI